MKCRFVLVVLNLYVLGTLVTSSAPLYKELTLNVIRSKLLMVQ